jgi:dissimilatory sulfite reductase related protein
MTTLTGEGRKVDVNAEGFLLDSSQWTPEIAQQIAQEVGISPLTERHWKVLTFCREDAARQGQSPGLRRIAKLSGVDMKELYQLFPKGPGKLAARIAGLPKPTSCV